MVDSLLHDKTAAAESGILHQLDLAEKGYALLTLHRPSNVDEKESLLRIITALSEISRTIRVVFPAHPRTRKRLKEFDLLSHLPIANREFLLIDPLGYLDFLNLEMNARFVMTDSGGIQEETTVLDVPCLTLRNTTERPITVSQGTNVLVWNDTQRIIQEALKILDGNAKKGKCPEFWDGVTAERIIGIITKEPKWQK
jgi:UDP-N-acetylglucosamine 2-epimerase (non-hydrolysing)